MIVSLTVPHEQDQGGFARLTTDRSEPAFVLGALLWALLGHLADFWPTVRAVPVEHLAERTGRRFPWSQSSAHNQNRNQRPSSGWALVVQAC